MLKETVSIPAVALDSAHVVLDVAVTVQPASTSPHHFHQFRRLSDDFIVTAQPSVVLVCFIFGSFAL